MNLRKKFKFQFYWLVYTIVLFLPISLNSQIVYPFNIRHQVNQKGGIVMLSNVALTCNGNNSNCAVYQAQYPPNGNHNQDGGITMGYVDVDTDASTWMSSSDSLNLDDCSQVTWAGLYWSARITTNTTNYATRNTVRIKRNNGLYQTLSADQILDVQNIQGNPGFNMRSYYCFKDVTSIIQAANGHGRFSIANIVSQTGSENLFGAWSIIVVYKNQLESMRNLTVFDGMAYVSNNNNLDIPISGFVTPQVGPVSFELGVVAFEGDRSIAGDRLQFNGNGTFLNVPDPLRSPTDFFNSTLTYDGALTPYRKPNYNNTLGFDTGIFLPDNTTQSYIGNNATTATVRVATSQDAIIPRVITSAIDIYEPDLRATVYINDLNGAPAQPNDILEYTVVAKNIGSDISLNTYLVDTLDIRTNYIPNTISYLNGPFVGAKTDAIADDQAEYDPVSRTIKARVSAGADALQGGSMINSSTGIDSAVVRFRVKVVDDCVLLSCDSTLENKAYLFGTGVISGNTFNNGGASDYYDANGCPTSSSNLISVFAPNCPPIDITYNNPLCFGDSLNLSVPYSLYANYSWTGPNGFTSNLANPSIPNASFSDAGNYTASITLQDGSCSYDNLVENVVVNPNPTVQLNLLNNVQCFNAANGSIQVQGLGNSPFTYQWTNSATNTNFSSSSSISGLSPGSYVVTIQDANTCFVKDTFEITQPTLLVANASITSNYNGQNISCFGASDGSANVLISGGVSPYNIQWSNGANTANISNLAPGTYTVTVTDFNGCVKTSSVTLTQPSAINLSDTKFMVSCFGGSNGSINLSVTGGIPGYSYSWSNGQTTEDISGLSAGTYNVLVTDLNGCTKTRSVTITQPLAPISLTETHVNVACFGNLTGSIDLSVTGGTAPYTYLWSNGATTQDISNLSSGTYSVLVTDSKNCQETKQIIVSQPIAPLNSSVVVEDVSCFGGNDGSVNLSITGGTFPYSFLWNNGFTTEDISALNNGNYSVVITDFNGCTTNNAALVSQPMAPLTYAFQIDQPNCFGSSDGSIDLTINGGTPPYQYTWSNAQITQDLSALNQGVYSVIVRDANQCELQADTNLVHPSQLQIQYTKLDVKCYGEATGTIDVLVSGGTPNYTYLWSNGSTTEDLSALVFGNYQVTITDSLGCSISEQITISQPLAPIVLTEVHQDALCIGGQQGNIDVSVSGGTMPYIYNWNNGQNSEDVQNLVAGFYYCVVTDFNQCSDTIGVTILDPSNTMVLTEIHSDVSCFNGSNGDINLNVSAGTPTYSYIWNNGSNSEDISNLTYGNYFVTVTDLNSCQSFLSVMINQPPAPLQISFQKNDVLCYDFETGTIDITATGGTSPYQYSWSNGSTDEDLFNLGSASYDITLTDNNGCIADTSITITQPNEIMISEVHQDVSCYGGNDGVIDITITGGVAPYNYLWSNGETTEDINSLSYDTYELIVTDANNCIKSISVLIDQPDAPLTLAAEIDDVSCFAGNDGAINVTPSGGNGFYNYQWSTNDISEDIQALVTGSYTITVTDIKNCSATETYFVAQPLTPISISTSFTPVICFGESNGTATVNISGGTPGYSINWSNGEITNTVSNLLAGDYVVTVLDTNLCSISAIVSVLQPDELNVNADSTNVNCFGASTGSVTAIPNGGISPYSFLWNDNSITNSISNLAAGQYSVVITDFNGCLAYDTTSVNQPALPLQISFVTSDNICYGASQGAIDASVLGGTPPYNYLWSTSEISDIISDLPVGNYSLNITDALGCVLSADTTIEEPDQIQANSQLTMVSCFNGSDASINLDVYGGVQPYEFSWSNGQISEDISGLIQGNYSITVTDSNLCEVSFSYVITQPDTLEISYTQIQPTCFGYSDGQLIATPSGGTTPYSYLWSNGDNSQVADSLITGTYNVLVSDANNCQTELLCTLNQPPQLQVSFDVDTLEGCTPFLVNFQNTSDPSVSCLWNFGDGQSFIGCDEVSNSYNEGGIYDVFLTIIDANGCSNNVTYDNLITVHQTPQADFNLDPQQLFSFSNTTTITNESIGGDFYIWNLGDEQASHLYFEPGEHSYPINISDTFLVSLIAQTVEGCADTVRKIILFNNDPFYYVPNTFIPDGDGRNDLWKPIFSNIENIKRYSLQVFNRWGELIFSTDDPNMGWNGSFGDPTNMVQDGTYVWKIQFSWFDFKVYTATGHVNLLR